ncbi:hypothetical protein BGZ95_008390 [Linnemannia exigua]|uniref:Uncharacterized protein n=1 Tax=Linnemannia exigua TaxID=604196 RepID=A0AAD4DEG6_9FUNG|nr:hypothetical protein BGZ95_008390 [Linnemannia exigua]
MAYTETTPAASSSPELIAAAALTKASSARNNSGSPTPSLSSASAAQSSVVHQDNHLEQKQQQGPLPASSAASPDRMSPTFVRQSPDQGSSASSQPSAAITSTTTAATTGYPPRHDPHFRPIPSSSSSSSSSLSYQQPHQPQQQHQHQHQQQQHQHHHQGSQWHVRERESGYVDPHDRYRALSSVPGQSSPSTHPSRSSPSEYPPHPRAYPGPPPQNNAAMPHSPLGPPPRAHHSPTDSSYPYPQQAARHYQHNQNHYQLHRRGDSDSDGGGGGGGSGYMDRKSYRYPHNGGGIDQPPSSSSSSLVGREQEAYPADPSHYMSSNSGKPHSYDEIHPREPRQTTAYPPPHDNGLLPPLAPRPRYSPEDDVASSSSAQHHYSQQQQHHLPHHQQHPYHHHQQQHPSQQQQQLPGSSIVKKESNPPTGPFRIQSARGTPKGPLPIDVQISLLTSVLQHDPFNCAIRKTTQAWESISREQGIRARTCSRRFDNIIQASIAGRDRPIGTEEQQATKKRLLEQLFEMMNQPQALKRMQKKRRYRSEDTDRQLLQETIRLNPFAQKVGQVAKAWEDVRDALKMKVHARQCIRRVNRMVKPYQLRERMYKGNIPEEMREANDDLVKQIINLMRQAGQGGTLDDGCNSNDEDSASFMSDSEDQEEYMDGQREHAQEDDEDDEDEEMQSRSESEQRSSAQKKQGENSTATPRSPVASANPTPSTQPTTPSLSAPTSSGTSSSTPATPAKRGRPRNPVPATAATAASSTTAQAKRHSSHGSTDRIKNASSADVNMAESAHHQQQQHQQQDSNTPRHRPNWEGEHGDSKLMVRPPNTTTNNGDSQSTPLSSPLPVHSPGGAPHPAHIPGHARHYSQGEFAGSAGGDYKRPMKHARTSSRGGYEIANSRFAPFPPTATHPGNSHGRPIIPSGPHEGNMDHPYAMRGHPSSSAPTATAGAMEPAGGPESLSGSSPSVQQYREILNEMHIMRDYLAQMDEHRRVDMEKQGTMMYTIEKMQHQLSQQQHLLSQLQHQLRYGPQQQPLQQEHSPPHHRAHPQPPSSSSAAVAPGGPPPPPTSSGRYSHPDEQQHITHHQQQYQQQHGYHRGGVAEGGRPGSEMSHYSSRPEGHFPAHDRELR